MVIAVPSQKRRHRDDTDPMRADFATRPRSLDPGQDGHRPPARKAAGEVGHAVLYTTMGSKSTNDKQHAGLIRRRDTQSRVSARPDRVHRVRDGAHRAAATPAPHTPNPSVSRGLTRAASRRSAG